MKRTNQLLILVAICFVGLYWLHSGRSKLFKSRTAERETKSNFGDADLIFNSLPPNERFTAFEQQVKDYFASTRMEDCNTKYMYAEIFCDASPGNGLKLLLQPLIMGFILQRKMIISIHRRSKCDGVFLEFNQTNALVLTHGSEEAKVHSLIEQRRETCSQITSIFTWRQQQNEDQYDNSLTCFNFTHHQLYTTVFRMGSWTELLSDLQFNQAFLSHDELARAKRIFTIGLQTAMGLLAEQVFTISPKVEQEFLMHDYRPTPNQLASLLDSKVLKVGMHIRHLPFIVKDESTPRNIDKRAFKCMAKAVKQEEEQQNYTRCVAIIATDMKLIREDSSYLESMLPSYRGLQCEPFLVQRTDNKHETMWGSTGKSDWESRSGSDVRAQLEAYLDLYVLSEYSHFVVVGTGSTFSNLISVWNSRKPEVHKTYEFQPASCKDQYFAYSHCCVKRPRWNDVFLRQGRLQFNSC